MNSGNIRMNSSKALSRISLLIIKPIIKFKVKFKLKINKFNKFNKFNKTHQYKVLYILIFNSSNGVDLISYASQ